MPVRIPGFVLAILFVLFVAGCGEEGGGALDQSDPLHEQGPTIAETPHEPPQRAPDPTLDHEMFAVRPPPFSPGIFPCSRCHEGGDPVADTRPALPHDTHLAQDLACVDCHAPDDEEADPSVPPAAVCLECHEDLGEESKAVQSFFADIKQEDGTYAFVRRWKTRDVIANHTGHRKANVECSECHGDLQGGSFRRIKSVLLMERCVACHDDRDLSVDCETCHKEIREPQHANIVLDHAEEQRGCLDCHDPDDRDVLHLVNGTKLPFEESYRLCGQCHGPKLRDWKVGLHGKRTGEWDGKKKYLLCVHCHDNPHAPRFPSIVPDPPPARPEDIK